MENITCGQYFLHFLVDSYNMPENAICQFVYKHTVVDLKMNERKKEKKRVSFHHHETYSVCSPLNTVKKRLVAKKY